MISRKTLFAILLGIGGALVMTWKVTSLPGHVVIMNHSGAELSQVMINTPYERIDVGSVRSGETRRVAVNAAPSMRMSYTMKSTHVWNAPNGIESSQLVVLRVTPDEKVFAGEGVGALRR